MEKFAFDQTKLTAFLDDAQQRISYFKQAHELLLKANLGSHRVLDNEVPFKDQLDTVHLKLWGEFCSKDVRKHHITHLAKTKVFGLFFSDLTLDCANEILAIMNDQKNEALTFLNYFLKHLNETQLNSQTVFSLDGYLSFDKSLATAYNFNEVLNDLIVSIVTLSKPALLGTEELDNILHDTRYNNSENKQLGIKINYSEDNSGSKKSATIELSDPVRDAVNKALAA